MFIVYSKEKISKEIFSVNLDKKDLDIVLGGDVFKDHPDLNKDDYIVVEQTYSFSFPTYDEHENIIREMTLIERYKNSLYELGPYEVEYKDNIITLESGQYINPEGELITVPKIEGVKVEWNFESHEWEETATNLEIVQAQYAEYEGMDTVSTVREMEQIDPAMADEFVNMLIELRNLAYTLSEQDTQAVGYSAFNIPKPSKKLQDFLNKHKLMK